MTDNDFMKLIKKTQKHLAQYLGLLEACETEYEFRYGHNPSEVDDDYWIDSMHQSAIPMTLEKIKENATK